MATSDKTFHQQQAHSVKAYTCIHDERNWYIITDVHRTLINIYVKICWLTSDCNSCPQLNLTAAVIRRLQVRQESWAIAKITARCALYMDALKNFGSPWLRPRSTFPENFNGLLLRSIVWKCVQTLKLVALPVPEIIGGTPKIVQFMDTRPTLHFSKSFNGLLFWWTLRMYRLKFLIWSP